VDWLAEFAVAIRGWPELLWEHKLYILGLAVTKALSMPLVTKLSSHLV
jgi:hypothetical protein